MIAEIATEPVPDQTRSRELQAKAHRLIPGGCHTYAKGDDQYPSLAPSFIVRGQGCHVWDIDGNEYVEYGMGNRCVTLGHGFEPVVKAAQLEMTRGTNFSRPAAIEVECAEQFLSMIDGAEMVKFAKNGSDVTSAAVKLSRAHTGRDMVALCADHPFFSVDDWFIGTTEIDAGIPKSTKSLSVKFSFNDLSSLEQLFARYPNRIACVVLEPAKYDHPQDRFLHRVRDLCHREQAVFILDEMITGFRWHNGGAQKMYSVVPDLSTFGKGFANGFALSALAGKRELMQRGGLDHREERVFLLSTTHGAETHALAAAIATMQTYKQEPVIDTLYRQGRHLQRGLLEVTQRHRLSEYVQVIGPPCALVHVTLDANKQRSQEFRTLLMQELVRRGILATSFVISYSHSDADIGRTIQAWDAAMKIYARALEDGVDKYLVGPATKSVYRKYN